MTEDGTLPPPPGDDRRTAGNPTTAPPPLRPPPPPPGLIATSSRTLSRPAPTATPGGPPSGARLNEVQPVQPIATVAQGLIGSAVVFSLFSVFVPEGREPAPFVQFANGMTVLFIAMGAVAVIVWLYRVASDVRKVGRRTRWSPVWAVFGWLLPPNLFVIPSLQMSELWKATSDREHHLSDESWRRGRTNGWIWTWSGLFAASYLLLVPFWVDRMSIMLRSIDWQDPQAQPQPTLDLSLPTGGYWVLEILSSLALALAGVALIVVIHQLTRRHDHFVGRSAT